jgi:hypothetical protein
MKKVLVLLSIVGSMLLIGCGDGSGSSDITAGGKNSLNPTAAPVKAGSGKSNGIADDKATPAPAGVKTGTPGG